MKFGETLQQQSIPAFRRHNIDYDDIKHFIKERTTPGKGKAVSIPGRADTRLAEFENDLFNILKEQHDRIGIFVKCKVGEVQRRHEDCNKILQKFVAKAAPAHDRRTMVIRLQRYGRLENDVIRAADELKSLARFNANQRTAFRKLLKKYRKWTGSADLEDRFREDVLDDPKSFTKLDLGPLLDQHASTRQSIRALYDETMQQASGAAVLPAMGGGSAESSVANTLRTAIESDSLVQFDASLASVPLGQSGTLATYFVHPDNVVELQMFLLHYARYFSPRSRANSLARPISPATQTKSFQKQTSNSADYHVLAADSIDRFTREQSALTVDDREHSPGATLQRMKAAVCWNHMDEAMAVLRSRAGGSKSAVFKSKRARTFFDRSVDMSSKKDISADATMLEIRDELTTDERLQPLFEMSCCRSRLVGHRDDTDGTLMIALDTDISISGPETDTAAPPKEDFPFALLIVRQEGSLLPDVINAIDNSYLVERVRGFSLEYHAVWQIHHPPNMVSPFWLPILDRDIRKLPPPAVEKRSSRTSQGVAAAPSSASVDSIEGIADSTTAVETANDTSQLGSPRLKPSAPRRKHTRIHPETPMEPQTRYWSEYDHPEDDENADGAYVIYVDPHERSIFDRFFDKVGKLFGYGHFNGENDLENNLTSPATDDETSSDEEAGLIAGRHKSYGTISEAVSALSASDFMRSNRREGQLPQFSIMCFVASLIILVFAYILAFTGRHKYIREVQAGIVAAVLSCLIFVITGFLAAFRRPSRGIIGRVICILVLLLDGIACGGLVAWYLVE